MKLYRLFDARNRLLYIGITADLDRRVAAHRDKTWGHRIKRVVAVDVPDTEASAAEQHAILTESPMFNVTHNSSRSRLDPKYEEELRRRKGLSPQASDWPEPPPLASESPNESKPEYVSLATAAQLVESSVPTLRKLISTGELKAYRLGSKLIRINLVELRTLMAQRSSARHYEGYNIALERIRTATLLNVANGHGCRPSDIADAAQACDNIATHQAVIQVIATLLEQGWRPGRPAEAAAEG